MGKRKCNNLSPLDFTIESDINYSTNSGYADGFQQNEWLWKCLNSENTL